MSALPGMSAPSLTEAGVSHLKARVMPNHAPALAAAPPPPQT